MSRLQVWLAWGLAAVMFIVVGLGWQSAAASTTEISDVGERSFADVAACVSEADTLLVSTVVDQSGSLQNTDPDNQRVGAVDTAVDALAGLREAAGGELDVQMNLAVFDGGYEEVVAWGSLSGEHPDRLRATAAAELPVRNLGEFTDYRAAVRGAQDGLRQRSQEVDPDACKVVLWFTDGRFDVGDATDTAVDELCAPRGMIDSLRGEDIAVIALALFTTEGVGSVSSADADLLRAVAEGRGDAVSCGVTPVPEDYAAGAYLHAADAGALRRVFAGAGTMIEGGQQAVTATCPGEGCVDGQFRVPLDPGVAGFRLVLDGVREESPPVLLSPEGEEAQLVSGDQTFSGADLSAATRDGLTMVDLAFPSGGSPGGRWILDTKATPERISVVDLYYFWGVGLEIHAPEGLTIGETSPVEALLTYPDGTPVDADPFQSLTLSMSVDGEPLALAPTAAGVFRGELAVPGQGAPSAVDVAAVAEAVSSPSSVRLGPVTVSARLSTVLPPAFATVVTPDLAMPQIVGDGTTSASLTFRGSEEGETRICVEDITVSGPEQAGDIAVTTESECLDIGTDAQVEWPVSVSPAAAADGRVEGSLTLSMTAVDGVDTITVDVPFDASMMRPVNEPLRWGLVVALVLLGLLLPVVIAWLTNLLNGTYRVSSRTVQGSAPVLVSARGLMPARDEKLLTVDDFEGLRVSGTKRWANVDAVVHLRRRLPWWPFGEVRYEAVSSDPSSMLLSSREPHSYQGRRAPADSNFREVFFLQVPLPATPTEAYEATFAVVDEDDPDLPTVIRRREEQVADFRDWEAVISLIEEEIGRRQTDGERGSAAHRAAPPSASPQPEPASGSEAGESRPSLWGEGGGAERSDRPQPGPRSDRGRDLWGDSQTPAPSRPDIHRRDDPAPSRDSDKPRSIFDD